MPVTKGKVYKLPKSETLRKKLMKLKRSYFFLLFEKKKKVKSQVRSVTLATWSRVGTLNNFVNHRDN